MTFQFVKDQTVRLKKTPYVLFTAIEQLSPDDNIETNLVMTIEQQEPLFLKFRNSRPEIQYVDPKVFSTTLLLKFRMDKDQTILTLSVKPNPVFNFLYILIPILIFLTLITTKSVETAFAILGVAILIFIWDCYCRLSIRRRVNNILEKVKY